MRILIIEDDQKLCRVLELRLKENDFYADICNHGGDAEFYIKKQVYDVIVLDRMLPGRDGLNLLKYIRSLNITTPVIMVTAMSQLENRVEGLDCGADDYLSKPFEMDELIARIRALGRRTSILRTTNLLEFSDLILNLDLMELQTAQRNCAISKREAELLSMFMRNSNRILARELLLDRVWGANTAIMDSNLDNFICFLRKRLKFVHSSIQIKTVRGVGYKLEDANA
jgi:DNA-binding response OmpR family regulator